MKSWKVGMLVFGVAVAAGFLGRWTESAPEPSFADEPVTGAARLPVETPEQDLGWLGLMVEKGPSHPVQVSNVFPGGPGAFAGIRKGDVILQVGEEKIASEEELAKAVEQLPPGKEAVIVVKRGEKEHSLKVKAGSLREFHHGYAREMWSRDPRDPNYATAHGVSHADLTIELTRRLFEQNQRLETSLLELRQEVNALRHEIKALKAEKP